MYVLLQLQLLELLLISYYILIIYIFMTGLIYFLGARANIPQCLCRSTAFWITDRDFVTIC
jgi:hypothetical protein